MELLYFLSGADGAERLPPKENVNMLSAITTISTISFLYVSGGKWRYFFIWSFLSYGVAQAPTP